MKFGRRPADPAPDPSSGDELDITRAEATPDDGGDVLDADTICSDLLANGMTGDKYRVLGKIGQGGMGSVFKVLDQGLQRTTVLKVLAPDMMHNPQFLKRFVDEARITGQLEHPNIIPVHDLGVVDKRKLFFSMKYIEGEELGAILRKLRRDDPDTVAKYTLYALLTIFRKVCDAVAFAHSKGILHRDVKPDNIMVARYGEVMLVDWGLARYEHDRDIEPVADEPDLITAMSDTSSLKTRDGMIKGTPAYMAPEQAGGQAAAVDRRTDIFLLGATLYAIATLQPPYSGESIYDILDHAEEADFVAPGQRAPERQIPEELCRIVLKAMARDPDDRYQAVEELSSDLDALLEGRTVSIHKHFVRGDVLMREGEPGEEAYVILSGRVEVTKTIRGQQVAVVQLGEGDTVGEMAMISNAPRSATVRAIEATDVVVITEQLVRQGLAKLPPWMGKTIQALVGRLRTATAQMHPLAAGDCTCHVVQQLRLLYPVYGRPMELPGTATTVVAMPMAPTVQEIAATLCVARDRVDRLLGVLVAGGLLVLVDPQYFTIPSFPLFCAFADYARQRGTVDEGLWRPRQVSLYVGPGRLAASYADPGETSSEEELNALPDTPFAAILPGHDEGAPEAAFEQLWEALHGSA